MAVRLGTVMFALAAMLAPAMAQQQRSPVEWVNRQSGQALPAGALVGGDNGDGRVLHLCRGQYRGGWHTGKLLAGRCNFGWGGTEIVVDRYQVLRGYGVWRRPFGDLDRSYIGGGSGTDRYRICRAPYRGGVHPGKVVAGRCNIGWGGREIVVDGFEALYPQ
ncbi:MAG: DUF3421 domain-containing protein [Beijerinckiaceae bacterium]|nr:DUF3421 domain-containing protein [Beijerinckiaceae bacterium]MCZ8298682.1 DUF3421 domain-containing protein [Beijerinckiaceae bacterium]